jgi:PAS domain-containing protein
MGGRAISDGEYPRARPEAHSGALLIGALVLGLALTRLYSYLLFHSLVEVFTIAVAWSVFFLTWNARRFLENHYLLIVGIAVLFVGVIDSVHTLAYKGMAIFPGDGANLPTQLWIAGRYVQSLSLLVAPFFLRRKLNPALALSIYAAGTSLLLVLTLRGVFPDCYVEGAGLTPFKLASEYVVTLILLASTVLLFRCRGEFDGTVFRQLAGSLILTMASELAFTLYVDVYGVANVVGHLLRFVAFCLLYRAIIVTGLVRPYDLLFRNLAQSGETLRRLNEKLEATVAALRRNEERYRAFVSNSTEGICRVEAEPPINVSLPEDEQVRMLLEHGRLAECNDAYARMHGLADAGQVIGSRLAEVLERSEPEDAALVRAFVRAGYQTIEAETCGQDANGRRRWIAGGFRGVVENGRLVRAWGVERDITLQKLAALERERLIAELQRALAEVKTLSRLLPMCANCKKIRDDQGYWTQVEAYLGQRAGVSFSHGICPDCLAELYPDYTP